MNAVAAMPLRVNLHHLARRAVTLQGELPVALLDIETLDEMIRLGGPLHYHMTVEKLTDQLLVRGQLMLELDCVCVRCLRPFCHRLRLSKWMCPVPLTGPEQALVQEDCVDLTPYVREDILLAFPQHPLCSPGCPGLELADRGKANTQRGAKGAECPSVWSKLDELRL